MNYKITNIIKLLLIALSIALLSSCDVKKNSADIEKEFQREFPNVKYEVLEKAENENEGNLGGYAVQIKAKDLDNDFTFNIYSVVSGNTGFGIVQEYKTDYLAEKLKFINSNLEDKIKDFEFEFGKRYNPGAINLYFKYIDKITLDKKMQELEDYLLYVFNLENKLVIEVNAIFDLENADNGLERKDPNPTIVTFSQKEFEKNITIEDNIKNKIDIFKESAFINYAINSRLFLLPNNDYPLSLVTDNAKYKGFISHFSVKVDGENYQWEDLITTNLDILHYRVLYEVLKRTEYESLEGTATSYSFIGKDNKKYEFSDKFIDEILDKNSTNSGDEKLSTYYLVDGEVNYFTLSYTRYLTFEKIKEITGYEFSRVKYGE